MRRLFLIIVFCISIPAFAQGPSSTPKQVWVDSVFNTMTRDQKIAQLIMYAAYSARPELNDKEIEQLISRYQIGGLIFMRGFPESQAVLTNRYQKMSPVPLLIAIDGEWGVAMRLSNTIAFPRQLPLAAMRRDEWIYEMGKRVAEECKALGIHINFAPVVDINNNPLNPVINDRSFGDTREQVARLALLYMKGLQDNGVMACLKHFPGHGDTETDSHEGLPEIKHDMARIDSVELYPFRKLFNGGAKSVMVAHLHIPAIDTTENLAVSLSPNLIQELLRKKMNYHGLVFTDALNMKGVAKFFTPGEIAVKALQAGNDVLLCPSDVPGILKNVAAAMDSCLLDSNNVYASVKKILGSKYDYALNNKHVSYKNAETVLKSKETLALRNKIVKNEITVVRNDLGLLPLKIGAQKKIVAISFAAGKKVPFQKMMDNYANIVHYNLPKNPDSLLCVAVYEMLKAEQADLFITSLHSSIRDPNRNFGMSRSAIRLINQLEKEEKQVVVIFGTPYMLPQFGPFQNLVLGYQDYEINQEKAAQYIFGVVCNDASIPVDVGVYLKDQPRGIDTVNRLTYVAPAELGIEADSLQVIDDMVNRALKDKTFPGCEVLIAKNGQVFYKKEFGYTTYAQNKFPVDNTTIYDLASLSKILSTTLAVMKLYEEEKLDLDDKISRYLKDAKRTNKADLTIKELLTHTAGLKSWIPFYKSFTANETDRNEYFSKERSSKFNVQVADSLFTRDKVVEMIWDSIWHSPLEKRGNYVYSDLSFYLLQKVVEKVSGEPLDEYVKKHFYTPLGLNELGYRPLENNIRKERIAPTELDTVFRRQLVWGYVHDQGAALMGGVAGNAGLFGTANDVAVIMQMLLNEGTYAGTRFLKKETVNLFTARQFEKIRRGCGFDKPEAKLEYGGNPVSSFCSPLSFGHSGFTGSLTWADPENGLVFVFLSNRVHPDANNNQITKSSVRTRILDAVYPLMK